MLVSDYLQDIINK